MAIAAGLISQLMEAQAQLRMGKLEAARIRLDLLILDEMGFVPFSKVGAELLFGLLTDRYERGSVLVTSNLEFASWTEVFGDPRLTAALLDRLTHRCHIMELGILSGSKRACTDKGRPLPRILPVEDHLINIRPKGGCLFGHHSGWHLG